MGKKISDGRMSWKGADLTSNYYVGRVDIDVDPQRIVDDIETQLGVRVIEFAEIKRIPNRYKSFRLCIRRSDVKKLLVEDFWPEDVVIDRYFGKRSSSEEKTTP